MEKNTIQRLERHLQKTFANPRIRVIARPKKQDSAEVLIDDEFIGVIFEDKEDGELSYAFEMAILDYDLDS